VTEAGGGGKLTSETMFFATRFWTFLAFTPKRREDRVSLELEAAGDTLTMSTWVLREWASAGVAMK
jgi:hypothetical protein